MHPFDEESKADQSLQSLLMEISRRYAGKCFSQVMDFGIHPKQVPVIIFLSKHDGCSQKEIATHMHVKPSTINVTIQRLEKAGFVCRKPDEQDLRATRVYLTEKSREVTEKAMKKVRENEDILFYNFSESELCLIRRFFLQIIDNIDRLPGDSVKNCMKEE